MIAAGKAQQSQRGQKLRLTVEVFQGGKGPQRGQGEPLIGPGQTEQAKIPAVVKHTQFLLSVQEIEASM